MAGIQLVHLDSSYTFQEVDHEYVYKLVNFTIPGLMRYYAAQDNVLGFIMKTVKPAFKRGFRKGDETDVLRELTSRNRTQFSSPAGACSGLGPKSIRCGDAVCRIFGVGTPFVLRPQRATYQLVGECFVDEIFSCILWPTLPVLAGERRRSPLTLQLSERLSPGGAGVMFFMTFCHWALKCPS